ncbi:MFS transporter [Paenibacillus sp. P96]|uniref:MFS transporter n=1 Tax=Paenibacillus zeirhizosphaerae TaxID=2987519 RepID=A0ABT9FS91_9BACL|nr:MFS transporter [Paenibacillus sp. P96]MDP4097596.1 MFS transporter [Paenibacillus sp. P96]
MKRLLWIGGFSYLLIGLAHVIIGSLLPVLLTHYGRDYTDGGTLIFAQFAGFLVGVLISPALAARYGKRASLVLALFLLCAAQMLYALLPPWGWLYPIGAAAGFGFGMVEAVIGTIVIGGVKEGTGSVMSRLEVFFGLGALAMPALAGWLILLGMWRFSFPIIALLAAAMAVFWLMASFGKLDPVLNERQTRTATAPVRTVKYKTRMLPLLVLFILFFFLYVGTEMSLANFLPSMLLERLKLDEAQAALSVTCFWLAMSAGRMFSGKLADSYGYGRYVVLSSAAAALLLMMFPLANGTAGTYALIILLGLAMSGIFSIALVFASRMLPDTEEMTTSLLIAAGGIGGALLPLWTGRSMDIGGAVSSAWLLAGFGGALCLLGIVLFAIQRRNSSTNRSALLNKSS